MDYFIGLDLGGTNLKYAVGDATGKILIKKIKSSLAHESQQRIFDNLFSAIDELRKELKKEVKAVGVGTPGSVNFDKGQIIGNTPNIKSWSDASVKSILEKKINIPVWVDNDANLMALAEARIGAGKGFTHVQCVTIGTGIGGGIILNDTLYRGANFSAAEVGHIIINMNGKPCNCGNLGCLEAYASAPAMVERYRNKLKHAGLNFDEKKLSTQLIFEKAALQEDFAIQTIHETCDYLGAGIASMVNIVNPQIVVIGGGVAEAGDAFIRHIEQVVKKHAMKANTQFLKVVKAKLGNDAGMVGAILLASENYKNCA